VKIWTITKSIEALNELELNLDLKNNFLVPLAKADVYIRKGEFKNARKFYEQALSLSVSPIDKKFLEKKILQCQLNTK
jgi:predicted RNA polymerase sigma factor